MSRILNTILSMDMFRHITLDQTTDDHVRDTILDMIFHSTYHLLEPTISSLDVDLTIEQMMDNTVDTLSLLLSDSDTPVTHEQSHPWWHSLFRFNTWSDTLSNILDRSLNEDQCTEHPRQLACNEFEVCEEKGAKCSICMDPIESEMIPILECDHRFHTNCIQKWVRFNPSCPVCRHNIPTEPSDKSDS